MKQIIKKCNICGLVAQYKIQNYYPEGYPNDQINGKYNINVDRHYYACEKHSKEFPFLGNCKPYRIA